ncbi:ankyrin repeat protein [Colletotrichum chrysophilum]|uniref:Ankyrin repeat protein n=1 Tax=Colletotrichum chrysophilum TaxID=1836956 RepID=A0AAD9A215_9PEZI|nr:ankyrin repeat protein [Colletotrichum chrysophilum]
MGTSIEVSSVPLYYAADLGLVAVVRHLVYDCENDVNQRSKLGRTPLYVACKNGNAELAETLLEKGADVAVSSNDGWTPLNAASSNSHVDVVKLLLEEGADVTDSNNAGWTPLYAASDGGHVDVAKLLLEKGADVTVANHKSITPLSAAARKGQTSIVAFLLQKHRIEVDSRDSLGRTAAWWARQRGHSSIVQMLVDPDLQRVAPLDDCEATVAADSQRRISSSRWCDICTFTIWENGICYQCIDCHNGNFDICEECFDRGGRCLNSSHKLVLRAS